MIRSDYYLREETLMMKSPMKCSRGEIDDYVNVS